VDENLFKYIWRYSKSWQLTLLGLTIASFPFLYMALQLPKVIVNDAIGGNNFPREYFSIEFGQISYLLLLCAILLALLVINALFQMSINTYKGILAERMLRRLRYILYERILRFPVKHFHKVSPGELSSMITAEVEPLGEFIGDSLAMPVFQGGTMATILVFMFAQDWMLGAAAISLVPLQAYIIPILQRRVNALGKERVRRARVMSGRIGESAVGINDVHANAASNHMLANFSSHLGGIFHVRFMLYKKKFFMKALTNFLNQLTPLLFYSFGGVLIIDGDLSFGALLAVLTAYSRFSTPWKVLLKYYQRMNDANIKYQVLVEQFGPSDMINPDLLKGRPETIHRLKGPLKFENVSFIGEEGIKELESVTIHADQGSRLAIVADAGTREKMAQLLSRLIVPTRGKITVGDDNLAELHESVVGLRVGYAGPDSYVFDGTICDNMLYGVKLSPANEEEMSDERKREYEESVASGNTARSIEVDWNDYESLGLANKEALGKWVLKVIHGLEIEESLYGRALTMKIDPGQYPKIAEGALKARKRISERLGSDAGLAGLMHPYDFEKYNVSTSVGANIIFGEPIGNDFKIEKLGENSFVREILDKCGMTDEFQKKGLQVAEAMVDMFRDIPGNNPLFEKFSFVDEESLKAIRTLTIKVEHDGFAALTDEEKTGLMNLTMQLVVERHRLGVVDGAMEKNILRARKMFRESMDDKHKKTIYFFDNDGFSGRITLRRNLLHGSVNASRPNAEEVINSIALEVLNEINLREQIILTATETAVGVGGRRLPQAERQRITLARGIIKRPDVMVINEALSAMDHEARERIRANIFGLLPEATMVWISGEHPGEGLFSQVIEMKKGRVVGQEVAPAPKEAAAGGRSEPTELDAEAAVLEEIPLFDGMESSRLKLLAFASEKVDFKSGEVLLKEGDPGAFAYVVIEGEGEIVVGDEDSFIRLVKQHEIVGEMSLLTTNPISATVRAVSDMTALRIKKETFLDIMFNDSKVSSAVAQVLSDRLFETTRKLLSK
jgi:ABC-type multidrug transport system fused ATPase/permease subunit